jgi:hypothetical protein
MIVLFWKFIFQFFGGVAKAEGENKIDGDVVDINFFGDGEKDRCASEKIDSVDCLSVPSIKTAWTSIC